MDSKLADIDEPNIRTLLSNSGGYNQTYIILKNNIDSTEYKGNIAILSTLFQCSLYPCLLI